MLKIAICDDTKEERKLVEQYTVIFNEFENSMQCPVTISTF